MPLAVQALLTVGASYTCRDMLCHLGYFAIGVLSHYHGSSVFELTSKSGLDVGSWDLLWPWRSVGHCPPLWSSQPSLTCALLSSRPPTVSLTLLCLSDLLPFLEWVLSSLFIVLSLYYERLRRMLLSERGRGVSETTLRRYYDRCRRACDA